jgi:NitT/TauT family transport system permease protein
VITRVAEPEPVVDQHARNRRKYRLIRLVSILVVLGAWELVGRQIDPLFMSYPSAVVQAAYKLTISGELPSALVSSLLTLALGFAIAAVLGVVAGLLIGRYKTVEVATDWLVNALYATPLVAVVPLVILWFGLGFSAKLFVVVLLAIFPVLINTASGVRNVPPALIDVGAGFAATEWQVFTKVILPASLPYTMTGLRLGVGRAIIGMVVAEFFTAITGLGALVIKYGNQFDTASMLVPVLVLMLLGVGLTAGLRQAEARIAPWKEEEHN